MYVDPKVKFENDFSDVSSKELGDYLKEYVRESNNQGWDGFSKRNLTGIHQFFKDFTVYMREVRS